MIHEISQGKREKIKKEPRVILIIKEQVEGEYYSTKENKNDFLNIQTGRQDKSCFLFKVDLQI